MIEALKEDVRKSLKEVEDKTNKNWKNKILKECTESQEKTNR